MTDHVDVHMHIPSVAEYKRMVERSMSKTRADLPGNNSAELPKYVAFSGLTGHGAWLNGREFRVVGAMEESMQADEKQVGGTHYMEMPMQPWEVMEAVLTAEEFRGFLKGNIIKYSMRAGHKVGAADDEAKAKHYRDKLREFEGLWQ